MQIAPTGGAAGTGVSEAKLPPTTGQTGSVAASGGIPPSTAIQQAALADTAVIRELAVSDLLKLTQILQPTPPPERVARVEQLVKEITEAIHEDRREWAVGRFIEAATTDPSRVEELRANPEFESIRSNVDVLLNRLTNVAKMDAESKLSVTEETLETGGWQKLPHWETTPEALVQIGHRLIEAGGYANYIRTSELATTLQTSYWAANVVQPPIQTVNSSALEKEKADPKRKGARQAVFSLAGYSWETLREKLPAGVASLWGRAPLLIILGAWFLLGLSALVLSNLVQVIWPESWFVQAASFGAKVWGIGLLAIVGFGFWARIRRPRRL